MRPEQYGYHSQMYFLEINFLGFFIQTSRNFVRKPEIDNISALFQPIVWGRTSDEHNLNQCRPDAIWRH